MRSRFACCFVVLALACSSAPSPKTEPASAVGSAPGQTPAQVAASSAPPGVAAAEHPPPLASQSSGSSGPPQLVPMGIDEVAIDPTVDPCVDFYHYACGGWLRTHPIPGDQTRWGRAFSTIFEHNEATLRELMDADARGDPDPADPYARKVGDFYATCMDVQKAETSSLETLRATLAEIEDVRDGKELARMVARLHDVGSSPLFAFYSQQDFKDATQVIGNATQGGLGLPDRSYYLDKDEKTKAIREAYQDHVEKMLQLAGAPAPDAKTQAEMVMSIETALAKASMDRTKLRDPYERYHRIDREGLVKQAPHFEWAEYFAARHHPGIEQVNVAVPKFFAGLDDVLQTARPADLRTYLRWHAINSSAPGLGTAFVDEDFRMKRVLTGQKELAPRWKRCVAMTLGALGEAIGRTFAAREFGADGKRVAKEMIEGIEGAFERNLATVSWMDDAARAASREKLRKIDNKVGYPDRWKNYDAMRIDRSSLLHNLQAAGVWESNYDLDKIGKPVNKYEWNMTPATVNAYYSASHNEMVFPAGILQPPFFSADAAPPFNEGGGGMVMGHELTHGFDDQGRKFDGDGNLREWWTPLVADRYKERAECVAKQYDEYVATGDVHVNGHLTLGENIADVGGLKLALAALRAQGTSPSGERSPERQLLLAFAQDWCTNTTDEALRLRARTDTHSPPQWRVNGPVSDNPEFAKVFSCKPGSPMNPVSRCEVW
jgi:putative endopeptidase